MVKLKKQQKGLRLRRSSPVALVRLGSVQGGVVRNVATPSKRLGLLFERVPRGLAKRLGRRNPRGVGCSEVGVGVGRWRRSVGCLRVRKRLRQRPIRVLRGLRQSQVEQFEQTGTRQSRRAGEQFANQ